MLIAADNLTASRPSVARAIQKRDAEFLARLCRQVEEAGAHWLDLNPGYVAASQKREVWKFLIKTAEKACGLKLMLDAPRAEDLETGLLFCKRPPILNMATAEESRLDPLLELAQKNGLTLVASTMTGQVPQDAEGRLALAALIAERARQKGITGQRLVLDPMVMPLGLPQGEAHAAGVLGFLRSLDSVIEPRPLTMIALSNLTTKTAGVKTDFAAPSFLAAAAGAGLDVVMMDALDRELVRVVRLCKVFKGQVVFAQGEFDSQT
ncbi:dihydropteroate synthase [Dethiosulfatarculus sandiegensis]|uniref:Pterin-binding domain-containing protein n=1 Tax=Dethiosulfatarculus sandiegensis TaxID=1429043 RepID=A0A0D2JSC0_9BACT|nr:dihydropteroate synthase [Dethiosulfatarculus sandiegensis]KIX12395.1 hypothetical protein X474_19535 [Dethiosulfatarculus sandiegensis]